MRRRKYKTGVSPRDATVTIEHGPTSDLIWLSMESRWSSSNTAMTKRQARAIARALWQWAGGDISRMLERCLKRERR
jgi:hypothetical protein